MTRFAPIDAPAPARPVINLLGAADTPTESSVRWQEGTAYVPESGAAVLLRDTCTPASALVRPRGDRGLIETTAVYAEVVYDCALLGDRDGIRDRALAALDAELPRAVERELWTGAISRLSDLGNDYLADRDRTVDLTPAAGAVTPTGALGMLQQALADVYSGPGIIHASRLAQPFLPNLDRTGRILETKMGNRVVPGVGYPGTAFVVVPPQGVTATPSGAGGALASDTYEYVVTATDANGETLPSAQVAAVVVSATAVGSVRLDWAASTGATGYRVYGRQAGNLRLLGTVAAGVLTFTDTGQALGAAQPPTTDTTGRPAAGEQWIYITPMVTVRIGEPEVADPQSGINRETNQIQIRPRVPFEVSYDGPAFAVRMRTAVE